MSSETQLPPPEPQENEATVLDLFKSVTKDWRSFFNFVSSVFSAERRAEVERVAAEQARQNAIQVEAESEPFAIAGNRSAKFPWRMLAAILLALFAQAMLEPPARRVELSLSLYAIALGLALWSYFTDEWQLPFLRADGSRSDPMSLRVVPLIIAFVLSGAAFFDLGNDLFTWRNLLLWLAAIGCFLWAMWLKTPRVVRPPLDIEARRKAMIWAALIIAVGGLLLFYRVYRVDSVPSEPFSDHAEKILDVYEITTGNTLIFFPRNTGREAIQMYWTLLMSFIFGTGLSFLTLKIGTVLLGALTLPFIYLLGKEWGGPRVGLFALFLFGIAYWPNVISRIGLRFPLYPLFTAPTLYYLVRGLRTRNRNDFLLCGLFLGLGLHGYSPFRIVPIAVVAAVVLFLIDSQSKGVRKQALWWLALVTIMSVIVFLPLLRYSMDNPDAFSYRALSRLGTIETPLPGPAPQIFMSNLWNGIRMFNWDDGDIWVNSLPHRPALDVVTGALFVIGVAFVLIRYLRRRDWRDLFLLVSIPILLLPSVLSLAYPAENPALNRSGGAAIPAILIAALALDGLVTGFGSGQKRNIIAWSLAGVLLAASAYQNYDLVFNQFDTQYKQGSWNTSEMGKVISDFRALYGETDTVWIVPFPYWVDTRLPGVWAGIPNRDFAMFKENLSSTVSAPFPKEFMYRPDDPEAEQILKQLYPQGVISRYTSAVDPNKDFMIYFVAR
jgi:hypothetical protein